MSSATSIELLLWGAGLLVLLIFAAAVLRIVRKETVEDSGRSPDLLTKFREMCQQGDISDAEFRTIKSVLGPKPRREISGGKDKG